MEYAKEDEPLIPPDRTASPLTQHGFGTPPHLVLRARVDHEAALSGDVANPYPGNGLLKRDVYAAGRYNKVRGRGGSIPGEHACLKNKP